MASGPQFDPQRAFRAERQEASPRSWQEFLSAELRCPVRVVYTRARRTPLQVRPAPRANSPTSIRPAPHFRASRAASASPGASGLEVRMHSMFVEAPPHVHEAVLRWIRSGRRAPKACAVLDRWIMESLERLPLEVPRDLALRPRGRRHDLEALTQDLLSRELAGEFPDREKRPRLTWGRQGPSRTRHSLRLGSFDPEGRVVRIHPVLDQDAVPVWFVRYVLFHELLHAVLPPRLGQGSRWVHHGREFRRRERDYADYSRAIAWEKAHMSELIRSARRAEPMRTVEPARTEFDRCEAPARKLDDPIALSVRETSVRASGIRDTRVRESGVHDARVRESGVRDTRVRESSVRDARVREAGVRKPGVRESGARENAVRETGARNDSRALESQVPDPSGPRGPRGPASGGVGSGERAARVRSDSSAPVEKKRGAVVRFIQAWLFPE
jgi:predicted metal-dependent hydrolase